MILYVVGQINPDNRFEWSFEGIFDSKDKAEIKCLDENYFVGEVELNADLGATIRDWEGAYYPKAKQ